MLLFRALLSRSLLLCLFGVSKCFPGLILVVLLGEHSVKCSRPLNGFLASLQGSNWAVLSPSSSTQKKQDGGTLRCKKKA